MTIGGKMAKPARRAQRDGEFRFSARPAINTAETQTVASMALSVVSGMPEAYAARPDRRCLGMNTKAALFTPGHRNTRDLHHC